MFSSFKIIEMKFDGFWSLPLIIAVTLVWLVFLILWNRPTKSVIGEKWSKRLLAIRVISGCVLLLYLFNPSCVYDKTRSKRGSVAVLIDASRSMDRRDFAGDISRLDSIKNMIREKAFLDVLARHAEPVCFAFDQTASEFDFKKGVAALKADGDATDIPAAFQHIIQRQPEEGWSAVILFSDGRNTAPESPLESLQGLGCPVYPVGVGERAQTDDGTMDRSIVRIQTNPTALIHQKNRIRVQIRQTGFDDKTVTARLEENGKTIREETIAFTSERQTSMTFDYAPEQKGLALLRISLSPDPADAVRENDAVEFTLPVLEDKIKVLYTEGTLRWEYKFLKRALTSDPNMDSVFLIRTAADQAFAQQGEGRTAPRGFPDSLRELKNYQCVILGDVSRAFISDRQIATLEKFVGDEGGGLIITGGYHILCSGEYRDTPLEKLLPVKTIVMRDPITPLEYSVIPETKPGDAGFQGLPGDWDGIRLSRWYPVGESKPGARVLLRRRTKSGDGGILAATHSYGKGRVILLASDEFWKPALARGDKDAPVITEKLYLQGIRWAANQPLSDDEQAPLFIPRLDQTHYEPGTQGTLHVQWNQKRIENLSPDIRAELVLNNRIISNLEFRRENPAEFTASFSPAIDGNYEIRIEGKAAEERENQTVKFMVGRPYREIESYALNENLLNAIAQRTRGGRYNLLNAGEIIKRIIREKRIEKNRIEREWAAQPGWILLFLLLMNLEWFLRRRKGLL